MRPTLAIGMDRIKQLVVRPDILKNNVLACEDIGLDSLSKMGMCFQYGRDYLDVLPPRYLRPANLEVSSTGISTDAHPIYATMLSRATGETRIREHVWKDRFAYVPHLKEMGIDIVTSRGGATIFPSHNLPIKNSVVTATDVRAAAALVLAALQSRGTSRIRNIYHIHRGYSHFFHKIKRLGANIKLEI